MSQSITSYTEQWVDTRDTQLSHFLRVFFSGLILPFGFAPFHFPGLAILSITLLFLQLRPMPSKRAFLTGFVYGLGFFGLGVSWIYVSIHQYGHLHSIIAGLITLLFIVYLALYLGFLALSYNRLSHGASPIWCAFLFSALWCVSEYLRSTIIGGFPWLLLGFGQMDSPFQHLLPIAGVLGVSFFTCLAAALLGTAIRAKNQLKYVWLGLFITFILSPIFLQSKQWTTIQSKPLSVGIIQANLSMRDKWDEALFWKLLNHYQQEIEHLLGKKQLIVLPESAIPLPSNYISDFLEALDLEAKQEKSAILLGIPHPTAQGESNYYNALMGLGDAEGIYYKQHLVAFGEFIPPFLTFLNRWLELPSNLTKGQNHQHLVTVQQHPIATLICYELAFPELLRQQLPIAEWIVSISDDGWFGHSLAVYQHLQMAQVLSKQTGRYQIVSNNDGLSALIKANGEIILSLPAFSRGVLEGDIHPATGTTPWTHFGDKPIHCLIFIILFIHCLRYCFKKYRAEK